MRHRVGYLGLLLSLLALAACSGTPTSASSASTLTPMPRLTPTAAPAVPTPTLPPGFVLYTSADHTYSIAYPANWQPLSQIGISHTISFTGPNQVFEVSELGPGADPAQAVNAYCQAMQAGVAPNPVRTKKVILDGQSWTRANCDAGAQSPAITLIVEAVLYHGAAYQIDYTSPIVAFARDDAAYYAPMERSFRFL
jgi:hypothetical protein